MRICQLSIRGFRGIKSAKLNFGESTVLLGANNCGKTAVADAVMLLFSDERRWPRLSEYDFFGGNPKSQSRFSITATVTDFRDGSSAPEDFPDWFHPEDGGRPVWWSEENKEVVYDTDPPPGTRLAVQIGGCAFYDEDACEFEFRRFFYDGETDPFGGIDQWVAVPGRLLRQVGVFYLPSTRQWEGILTFGSRTYLRVLKEYGALPGPSLQKLKEELREPRTRIEQSDPFGELMKETEAELRAFFFAGRDSRLVYRVTSLDTEGIFQALTPFLDESCGSLIPVSKQGGGFVSLQMFLILLAFAKKRKKQGENFILVAEEPELHLHPCLQSSLINRIRAHSDQAIFTTHSPKVASFFPPEQVTYMQNVDGTVRPEVVLRGGSELLMKRNQVRRLYLEKRPEFFEALLGKYLLLPEGKLDWHWLTLWVRVAQSCSAEAQESAPLSLTLVPTGGGGDLIVDTFEELRRFRGDVVVLLDNDAAGKGYKKRFEELPESERPRTVVQFGEDGEIEDLAAWVLEEAIARPGECMAEVLKSVGGGVTKYSLAREIKCGMRGSFRNKEDTDLHERLAWEAYDNPMCRERALHFVSDLSAICSGEGPSIKGWHEAKAPLRYFRADFIKGTPDA